MSDDTQDYIYREPQWTMHTEWIEGDRTVGGKLIEGVDNRVGRQLWRNMELLRQQVQYLSQLVGAENIDVTSPTGGFVAPDQGQTPTPTPTPAPSTSSGGCDSCCMIRRPCITCPPDGATNFIGSVNSSKYAPNPCYVGQHLGTFWQAATDQNFTDVVAEEFVESGDPEDTKLFRWAPDLPDEGTMYYIRVRYLSDHHLSAWSKPSRLTTVIRGSISAPGINASNFDECGEPILQGGSFMAAGACGSCPD